MRLLERLKMKDQCWWFTRGPIKAYPWIGNGQSSTSMFVSNWVWEVQWKKNSPIKTSNEVVQSKKLDYWLKQPNAPK